jgi:hypothetical protein
MMSFVQVAIVAAALSLVCVCHAGSQASEIEPFGSSQVYDSPLLLISCNDHGESIPVILSQQTCSTTSGGFFISSISHSIIHLSFSVASCIDRTSGSPEFRESNLVTHFRPSSICSTASSISNFEPGVCTMIQGKSYQLLINPAAAVSSDVGS